MLRPVAVALLLLLPFTVLAEAHITKEPVTNDGTPVQLDLPAKLHLRNKGGSDGPRGPGSGSGLCVWTSINHTGFWQNVPAIQGIRDWMTHYPGGGWPGRTLPMIDKICTEKGLPKPRVVQVESNDLDILRLAVRNGFMPGITYGYSPTGRYNGRRIAHMVTLLSAGNGKGPDGKGWWTILDNNYPDSYEHMSESQFLRSYSAYGRGWAVIIFDPPGPPPAPTPTM